MGLFDRIKATAGVAGNAFAKGTTQLAGKAAHEAKEAAKITAVKADLAALQSEIDSAYTAIGRAYVEAMLQGAEVSDVGCGGTLKLLEPKLEKKMALEKELADLERELIDSQILQERQLVIEEINEVKAKLDKAKAMGAISEADYAEKLTKARKKLDYFEEIRMLKKQHELGIITLEEMTVKVNKLQ